MFPIDDVESEIVRDMFRNFINDLALRAIELATSPEEAHDEVATALDDRQYELDRAFDVFVSMFRQPAIGDLNISGERLSRVPPAVNDSPTDGNAGETLRASNDSDINPMVDPTHVAFNGVDASLFDTQVDGEVPRLEGLIITMETPENETYISLNHVYGHIDAPPLGRHIWSAISPSAFTARHQHPGNRFGTRAVTDGDADRPAQVHGQLSRRSTPLVPSQERGPRILTTTNGDGTHHATEDHPDHRSEADDPSVATTYQRESDDDVTRVSNDTRS
jgi:hypothetical protein